MSNKYIRICQDGAKRPSATYTQVLPVSIRRWHYAEAHTLDRANQTRPSIVHPGPGAITPTHKAPLCQHCSRARITSHLVSTRPANQANTLARQARPTGETRANKHPRPEWQVGPKGGSAAPPYVRSKLQKQGWQEGPSLLYGPTLTTSPPSLYWRLGPHHRGCVFLPSLRWKRNLRLFGISNMTAGVDSWTSVKD